MTPQRGFGTGFTTTAAKSLEGALNNLDPELLPDTLAGRPMNLIPALLPIGIYGNGLSAFAVLTLRGSTGLHLLNEASAAGGTTVLIPNGTEVAASAPLITVVLVHPDAPAGRRYFGDTYLLAGLADAQVLEQAAGELASRPGRDY